jgi:hypothetical protein
MPARALALAFATALAAAPLPGSVLWSETFDQMPSGPLAPGVFNSTIILPDCAATIVPVSPGRHGLLLQDGSASGRVLLERNFVSGPDRNVPAVHVGFTLRKNDTLASADSASLLIGLGAFNYATSSHFVVNGGQNRSLDIRFRADGRIMVSNGSAPITSQPSQALRFPSEGIAVNLYANAGPHEVEIPVGPDGTSHTLAPGRFSVWIGQTRVVLSGLSEFAFFNPNSVGFGRLGFFTGNAHSEHGLEFTLDNIVVTSLPSPATAGDR